MLIPSARPGANAGAAVSASPGARFRAALAANPPLPIVGAINPFCAMLAEQAGHQAIYLAGGGMATHSYGLPDLALTTMTEVLENVRRITDATDVPLLVDVDTGFGGLFNIARLVRGLIKDGAAALHIEDQVALKRCGHRPNKSIVSMQEMVDRIKACVDARTDPAFFIVARTDSLANEGLQASIDRACAYMEAGADMIFAEACSELSQYRAFVDAINRPHSVMANITEFSLTPSFSVEQLRTAGVSAALFPLSAARAMAFVVTQVYQAILRDGTPSAMLGQMQTRAQLYEALDYHAYEKKYDDLYTQK
ncbi:MAG: methylisocitrate lyase [Rhodoferax sp.]|nr:methylisocitrate lyase [Rhodoferax sp.]